MYGIFISLSIGIIRQLIVMLLLFILTSKCKNPIVRKLLGLLALKNIYCIIFFCVIFYGNSFCGKLAELLHTPIYFISCWEKIRGWDWGWGWV